MLKHLCYTCLKKELGTCPIVGMAQNEKVYSCIHYKEKVIDQLSLETFIKEAERVTENPVKRLKPLTFKETFADKIKDILNNTSKSEQVERRTPNDKFVELVKYAASKLLFIRVKKEIPDKEKEAAIELVFQVMTYNNICLFTTKNLDKLEEFLQNYLD